MTLVDDSRALYARAFGGHPAVIASAPGRVNLIGEHTDYNGGDVLPIAIDARTVVAVGPARSGDDSRAVSTSQASVGTFRVATATPAGEWWDYVAGALRSARSLGAGGDVNLAVASDVPVGAGLSSSAALEVATVVAAAALAGASPELMDVAVAAHRADHEYVGIASGIMDQFASALGRAGEAMLVACDTRCVTFVPFSDAVLIFDTGVTRALRQSLYLTRVAECRAALQAIQRIESDVRDLARAPASLLDRATMAPVEEDRARHVIEETARVSAAVQSLREHGRIPARLLVESHRSLQNLYACSSPELDWFVDRAVDHPGVRGARLTGAGWGGCAIAVGDEEVLRTFGADVAVGYRAAFARDPQWWVTRAAAGARVERDDS